MNGEGFAFFRWRVMCHPDIGDDADWWEFWQGVDFYTWRTAQGKEVKP
jgi:hypothetical protein